MTKNLTISIDEETARWIRKAAAEREMSMSRFVASVLSEQRRRSGGYEEAMKRYLAGGSIAFRRKGEEIPDRAARHERDGLR